MVPEVLDGMLWLARLGLRSHHGGMRAGHGYADPGFRPSTLPFASLIGPLKIEVEPERDLPVPSDVLIQLPGFIIGAPRAAETVAAGMTLSATFDRVASATITLNAGDFSSPAAAAAVCDDIETAFRAAATANAFTDADGNPVTDTPTLAELQQVSCRWDASLNAVALSSGHHGYLERITPSTVVIDGGSGVTALGLDAPAQDVVGRHARQRAPAPKGFALDLRFDLWAATQRDLGYLIDALIHTVPTRTRMVTRPGLLAADLAPGDTSLRLLDSGEPTLRDSLLHLEAGDGFLDRVSGEALTLTAGASELAAPPGLRFSGSGSAGRVLVNRPSVPDPRRPDQVAPEGVALSLALTLEGGADGDSGRILSLDQGGNRLLRLEFAVLSQGQGASQTLLVDLAASAVLQDANGIFTTAATTRRVALTALNAGLTLQIALNTATGRIGIAVDGQAQALDDPAQTPTPPTTATGTPPSGDGLRLLVGNDAGNPLAFVIGHLHLIRRPLPPLDPHLRGTATSAARYRPGDHLSLAESDNGYLPHGHSEGFHVRAVSGDRIDLDRPVARTWRRGLTLVHERDCFLHQTSVKRRDDLMNRLYQYCIGYRVSTLFEQADTAIDGGLVVDPRVDLELRNNPRRVASGAPGARAVDADPHPTDPG